MRKHNFAIILFLAGLGILLASRGFYADNLADFFSGQTPTENNSNGTISQSEAAISAIADKSEEVIPKQVLLNVPFTPQAPFGDWDDVRQDNGCEEASLLMAMHWVTGKELTPQIALQQIVAMVDFQLANFGHFHDTSTEDTLKLLTGYFNYDNAFVKFDITARDIKEELAQGNVVIVPVDGKKLGNPFYTPPGPDQHKLLIKGYDDATQEFITNDPGTKRGEGYRYNYKVLESAILEYKTGLHEPIDEIRTAMLVVSK